MWLDYNEKGYRSTKITDRKVFCFSISNESVIGAATSCKDEKSISGYE